jgi:hypothetical protein
MEKSHHYAVREKVFDGCRTRFVTAYWFPFSLFRPVHSLVISVQLFEPFDWPPSLGFESKKSIKGWPLGQ